MDATGVYVSDSAETAAGFCAAGYDAVLLLGGEADASVFGRRCCDFQDGTLLFLTPQSALAAAPLIASRPVCRLLAFDPARFRCTACGCALGEYAFFHYDPCEMLHLSAGERRIAVGCMADIRRESDRKADTFSCRVLARQIGLLLDHCTRFYERQFITRSLVGRSLLARYESFLARWIGEGNLRTQGLPPEPACAADLGLSTAYFRSLLQFETGLTPTEYVQRKRIETARLLLSEAGLPVCEIASLLGFPSEQCFSRFLKKVTGLSLSEYRLPN